MGLAIGIDLGTSYSCAAAVRDDAVVVAEDVAGRRTLPSMVYFGPSGEVAVGHEARSLVSDDPEHVIHSAKRFLGRRFDDGAVRIARNAYFYKLSEGPNGWPVLDVRGGPYTVPEVCACVLKALKSQAENFFGEEVTQAVITVPAGADDAQREQTRIAGRIAGLEVLKLLNEPTAAALAHALAGPLGRTVVIYDFGGGTFDCSVMEWGAAASTVLATHGDTFLGGDDIDLAMAVHVAGWFQRQTSADVRQRASEWKRLLLACEAAKVQLSEVERALIRIPAAAHLDSGPVDLACAVDRPLLDRLAGPLVQQTVELMAEAVSFAGLEWSQVDDVLLVGGSSRLEAVRAAVERGSGRVPHGPAVDPDTAVCMGAAVEAHRLSGGRSVAVARAPSRMREVVPHSIGLATAGGGFDVVIGRNSPIPARGTRRYTTWRDGQEDMRFVVLQGDGDRAESCVRLGEFVVDGLPPRPASEVKVELLFEVGGDGLLRATARDTTTNRVHQYRARIHEGSRR